MSDFFGELRKAFSKYKINFLKVLLAIWSYWSVLSILDLRGNYNALLLLILVVLIILFIKVDLTKDKSNKKVVIFTAIVCALSFSLGSIINSHISEGAVNIFDYKTILYFIFLFIGIFILFLYLNTLFFANVKKVNLIVKNERQKCNKVFFISWAVILIAWLPYFLRYFPGIMSLDSRFQLYYIEDLIFMNNHPFVQTWFEGGIYNLGKLLFHNSTLAMGFYVFIQMLILSALFAYVVRFLYKHKFHSFVVVGVLLVYALLPQFTTYAVTVWKDVLFGGAFVLLLISVVEMSMQEKIKKGNLCLFILSCLLIVFFRNNGIYVLLFCIPFFLYGFRKQIKTIGISLACVVITYFVVTGPIYDYLKVGRGLSVESLAIPIQQVGRVVASGASIDSKSEKYLKSLFDFNDVEEAYKAHIVDPTKNSLDKGKLERTKNDFYSTWFRLFIAHPDTYIEAYLSQTLGYWYPSVKYWTTSTIDNQDSYGVKNKNLLPAVMTKVVDKTTSLDLLFAPIIWGIGLGFMTLFFSIMTCVVRKIDKKMIFVWFASFVGLWITMLIASPVFAEYRYVYGLFTCLPLIVFLPFIFTKKSSNKN